MQKNLRSIYLTLPQNIKDWMESMDFYYRISDITKNLNILDDRMSIVPDLIFRLVTQDLDPRDFAAELAIQLRISDNAAHAIAKEVYKNLLQPIDESFRKYSGVDLLALHPSGNPGPLPRLEAPAPLETPEQTPQRSTVVSASPLAPTIAPTIAATPPTPAPTPASDGPMIIHTEREEVKTFSEPPRQMFSIKIPTNKKQYVAPPVVARVEIGAPEEKPSTSSLPMRPLSDVHPQTADKMFSSRITKINIPVKKDVAADIEKQPEHNHAKTLPLVVPISKVTPASTPITPAAPAAPKAAARPVAIPVVKKIVHYSEYRTPLQRES